VLEAQKGGHRVIGQALVGLGLVSEQQVDWALAVQAGRLDQPSTGPDGAEELELIDGTGWLIAPGLINTHHHLFQTLTRCMPAVQNARLFEWLTRLYPVWETIDAQAVHAAATIGLGELLLSGCTTSVDHMYLFPRGSDVKLEAVVRAAAELGVRIHACRGEHDAGSVPRRPAPGRLCRDR